MEQARGGFSAGVKSGRKPGERLPPKNVTDISHGPTLSPRRTRAGKGSSSVVTSPTFVGWWDTSFVVVVLGVAHVAPDVAVVFFHDAI